jgi:hypothetical protein
MHIRTPKFAKVVDPASRFRSQNLCYLIKGKMYHAVYPEFKTFLIDPLLTLTADTRCKSHLDYTPDFDYSWFKCKAQKIKGPIHLHIRDSWLLTIVAINYLRLTLIKV